MPRRKCLREEFELPRECLHEEFDYRGELRREGGPGARGDLLAQAAKDVEHVLLTQGAILALQR